MLAELLITVRLYIFRVSRSEGFSTARSDCTEKTGRWQSAMVMDCGWSGGAAAGGKFWRRGGWAVRGEKDELVGRLFMGCDF